jgi:TetR/AcrR family transcriptional regulator, mexCD-oprJ operon repressor
MTPQATDPRRETAERNVQAILDATEELLARRQPVTIAAVAKEAGVSRVTVYAHFETWEALVEAVVRRAVERCAAAIEAADLTTGPPLAALDRLLSAGWRILARNDATAAAAAAYLSSEAMHRSHHAVQHHFADLVDRGRADGSFRTDVPVTWLVSSTFALIHTCAEEVRGGRLDPDIAEPVLAKTVRDLLAGTA